MLDNSCLVSSEITTPQAHHLVQTRVIYLTVFILSPINKALRANAIVRIAFMLC